MSNAALARKLPGVKTLTFDCYGTLIDWRAGLESSFLQIFGPTIMPLMHDLYERYVDVEKEVEARGFQPYRDVLAEVAKGIAQSAGVPVTADQARMLAVLLPDWRAYTDTTDALQRLKKRFRLGILSNVDRDLFAGTNRKLGVEFDFIITAQDVESYKPAPPHFERMLAEQGTKEDVLHVAQSVFHDGAACAQLGIDWVWINRYEDANTSDVKPLAEFPDLDSLATAAGC